MLAQQIGQWFSADARQQEVKVGAVFRKNLRGNIVEIAEVIDIVPDSIGIPHVHFVVSIQGAHRQCFREPRTLGLAAFSEMFSVASTAAPATQKKAPPDKNWLTALRALGGAAFHPSRVSWPFDRRPTPDGG